VWMDAAMTEAGYQEVRQTEDQGRREANMDLEADALKGPPTRPPRAAAERTLSRIQDKWKLSAGTAVLQAQLHKDQAEHITNLALFGVERSDGDLHWKWESVGNLISELNDPARPPVRGCNKKFLHWKLLRIVENIYFRLLTFLLIFVDIGFVIAEMAISCAGDYTSTIIRHLELVLSIYFLIEVFLRIMALTPKVFFSKRSWHNIIDFFVVLLAFAASIATAVIVSNIETSDKEKPGGGEWTEETGGPWCEKEEDGEGKERTRNFALIVALRFIRIFRFVRLLRLYFEHHNVVKSVRQKISENKRRYQVDGYDLDLTYVTTHIIAMSFPSKGTKAVYRNKIDHVAKFFEDKYSDDKNIDFMIYNLCSEMEYDHRKFHGNVRRYQIDDHNVPTLDQMIALVQDVRNWLSDGPEGRERVVALHCKGGKGRTGTMICAVLIDQNLFEDAGDTLQYFGQRRTDLNVSNQFQGVETYSQIRYVHYFQEVHKRGIKIVPSRPLRITNINITGLRGVGAGNGSDFTVTVQSLQKEVLKCSFKADSKECKIKHDAKVDRLEVVLTDPPLVDKDTKFMFFCSSKGVPMGYDDCAFFFWLNTFFIKGNRLLMVREELDNPHKEKTWRVWRENFSVEVVFQGVEQAASHL